MRGADKTLILPNFNVNQSETIGNITFEFGDLFNFGPNSVPFIPAYTDGFLYKKFSQYHVDVVKQKSYKLYIGETNNRNVPFSVFFIYSFNIEDWYEMFVTMFKFVIEYYEKDLGKDCSQLTLLIPTFGTNNGISYANCANGILFSLLKMTKNNPDIIKAFKSIKVLTPYGNNGSSRVISHIFNLLKIYNSTIVNVDALNPECCICMVNRVDVIFKCGHYICCTTCLPNLTKCPFCYVKINENDGVYRCGEIINNEKYMCCNSGKQKVNKAFIPCGHSNIYCVNCDSNHRIDKRICPICNMKTQKYMLYYGLV